MKALRTALLVLGVAFLAVGVAQCYRWSRNGEITIGYLVNLLPSAVLLVSYGVLQKYKSLKWLHLTAVAFGAVSVAFWIFLGVAVESFIAATAEVRDIRKYEEILSEYWSNSDLVTHFPRPIPKEATDLSFSFRPAFLQGGAHIQLRMTLPPERAAETHAAFSRRKTKSFFGGNMNDHMNMDEGMPTTFFYTSGTDRHEFPEDYEIMILDEVLKEKPEGFYWNHGRSHGVAIGTSRNVVVYWAESW